LENGNGETAVTTAPAIATPSVTLSQPNKNTAAGVRKRKAATTAEATKDLAKKKTKQVKKESAGDAEGVDDAGSDTEDGDRVSSGCEGAEADRVKVEE
jgi:hypothetical protein